MNDVESIAEAVYAAVAGIVLRGQGINPQEVVAALERVQGSLAQVRAYWLVQAREHVAETNLRNLRTEPVQVALTGLEREQVGGLWAFKVHKGTTAAEVFERNGWREVKRRHSLRYFVIPDGSEPPAHLTPVVEFAVPTREEIIRLANQLHAAKARAGREVNGIHVSYSPSSAFRMTNRAGKEYTRRHPARFMLFKNSWLVTATWSKGDDRPPEWCFSGEGEGDAHPLPEPALRLVVEREHVGH